MKIREWFIRTKLSIFLDKKDSIVLKNLSYTDLLKLNKVKIISSKKIKNTLYIIASSSEKEGVYCINRNNVLIEVVPFKYDNIDFFDSKNEPYIVVEEKGKKGLYDYNKKIIPIIYDDIIYIPSHDSFKVVLNNLCGIYNHFGNIIIPCTYNEIQTALGTGYMVYLNNKVAIYSVSGRELIPLEVI